MKRRRKIFAVVIGLGIIIGIRAILVPSSPPDPVYDGKPLSYWLTHEKISQSTSGIITSEPALDYTRLDTNAIPYLVYAFERRDGRARRGYAQIWIKLPSQLQSRLPKPRDTRAIRGLALAYLLKLEVFNSPQAISAMVRTIEDDEETYWLKWWAIFFLEKGQSKDPAVIQALCHGLKDKDERVREECTNALRTLDPVALKK